VKKAMQHNNSPISLREGKVFLDGEMILDDVACTINFTPTVWTGQQLGERTPSSRWLSANITGSLTRRRSTNCIKEKIKTYLSTGRTPEMTIQGIMSDEGSDYFQNHGSDTVTCVGCVLTGDLPLTRLDSNGDVVDDVIAFNAKDIIL